MYGVHRVPSLSLPVPVLVLPDLPYPSSPLLQPSRVPYIVHHTLLLFKVYLAYNLEVCLLS